MIQAVSCQDLSVSHDQFFYVNFFLPELPPGFKGDMKINSEKYHDYWLVTFFLQLCERYDVHSVEIVEILSQKLWQKFRESNGFSKEVTKELISRKIIERDRVF